MNLNIGERNKMLGFIAVLMTCIVISWASVHFLGNDNIVEEEMKVVEINLLEKELHLSPEEAEKDVNMINPKCSRADNN